MCYNSKIDHFQKIQNLANCANVIKIEDLSILLKFISFKQTPSTHVCKPSRKLAPLENKPHPKTLRQKLETLMVAQPCQINCLSLFELATELDGKTAKHFLSWTKM